MGKQVAQVNFIDGKGTVVGWISRDDEDNITADTYGRQMLNTVPPDVPDDCAAFELFQTGWTRSSLIHPESA